MSFFELLLLAVGLAMDAFAVAICKGLAIKKANPIQMSLVGAWFGGFQALMPLIGYFLGINFSNYITKFDDYIFVINPIKGYIERSAKRYAGELRKVDGKVYVSDMMNIRKI